MSGPVSTLDAPVADVAAGHASPPCVDVSEDRSARVGHVRVQRALPRRGRRTVGAWCFADHIPPTQVSETSGLDIGPHPHIGLQTVTWLLDGQVLHRDSLGSEQVIQPGELNLMTAGRGVSHSEEATGSYRGGLHGVQLWVAQPQRTRWGAPAFEHHGELPRVDLGGDLDGAVATVLVGEFGGATSPARRDTVLVGVDVALGERRGRWPLRREFEYAVVVLDQPVTVNDCPVSPGRLAYLGRGRDEVALQAAAPAHAVLLGGVPFDEPILMWWNFVARSRDEVDTAYADWQSRSERFGRFESPLPRIPAPRPPWNGQAKQRTAAPR